MEILAASHDRIEIQLYPTRKMVEHGILLTLLALRERSEWFAFCDADIFTRETPAKWFEAALEVDGQSACSALLLEDVEERVRFSWSGYSNSHRNSPVDFLFCSLQDRSCTRCIPGKRSWIRE